MDMVRDGLGDKSGAKLIAERGIDFAATEDFVQSLKAAGASDTFLRALRNLKSPTPAGMKRPLDPVQVFALLASQGSGRRVATMVQQRGIAFQPSAEYLQDAHLAAGGDVLVSALKSADVASRKDADPALDARIHAVWQHTARGAESMREQRYADAEREYRTALALAPQESDLHLSLAWALTANHHLDQAMDECREALRLDETNDVAHYFLAGALGEQGDADGEIGEYRTALRFNPANALAHLYLGIALARQSDWEGAVVQYREALRLDAGDANSTANLLIVPGPNDGWHGVSAECRKVLAQNPNPENMRMNLGLALGMDGDWDAAIAEERQVTSTNPVNALALYILGIAYDAKGDRGNALQQYRAALQIDPTNRDYRQACEHDEAQPSRKQ